MGEKHVRLLINSASLEKIVTQFPQEISTITDNEWQDKPTPKKWSKKEVLGHLVDSALNNLQRYIKVQFKDKPLIVYRQDEWVNAQNWQDKPIADIITLWVSINQQILHVWKHFPIDKTAALINISEGDELLYSFLDMTDDYIEHFYHHKQQILTKKVTIIAAIGKHNELGKDNDLIWRLPADLKRFKKVTTGHHIIMGRKTYESIGKPLPNRTSIIITRQKGYQQDGCLVAHSLAEAIDLAATDASIFIIGGSQIYQQALEQNLVDQLDITIVHETFDADVFFPEINTNLWKEVSREDFKPDDKNKYSYSFVKYSKA